MNRFLFLLLFFSNFLFGEAFLSYKEIPKKAFINQAFVVKVRVIISNDIVKNITTHFENGSNVVVINEKSKWRYRGNNTYENIFYYKIRSKDFKTPQIRITYTSKKNRYISPPLSPFRIKVISLNADKYFCNVIAKDFKVTTYKSTNFDTKHNIIVLRIRASYSNLEDMKLSFPVRDGINSKEYKLPITKAYYFAIIPQNMRIFKFNYFNLKENRFKTIKIAIEIADDDVSTHYELNPNKNRFLVYKTIALISFASLFLLLFMFKRKIIFLLLAIIIGGFLAYSRHPLTNKIINKGTKVRILPTANSTIFYVAKKRESVEILNIKKKYVKILLPNNSVGWVLNEDFIKN